MLKAIHYVFPFTFWKRQNYRNSKISGCQGLSEGRICYEEQNEGLLGGNRSVLNIDSGHGHTTLGICENL